MGYIKKLKNNELVGGTDKTTIYPVTSTEAVFEEITNGNESSFKSQKTINKEQQDELDDHEERIQAAEAEDIKSITINGSTKKFEVDDENNVDLTIYTVDSDPDMPDIADNVRDLRNMVGTSTPVLETSHKTRIENLETTVGTGGTVDSRIATTKAELEEQIAGKQKTLSVGSGITLTSEGVISATADPSVGKVVESRPTTDIVDGMIYLVQTDTPGTYKQWVHSNETWVDKGNISLGITTDDTLDSTSSNPIQNAAIAAQIGYFVCGNGYASSEIKDVDALGFKLPDVGGDFKIKMNAANTHAGPVYLRFNSSNDTKAELKYNRESVSPTNTWNAGEVISVYYDGTYYQASNAMGGGNVGKKKLTGVSGTVYNTAGDRIGTPTTGVANFVGIKYPVSAGDVVVVSGTGGGNARLWAIAGTKEGNEYDDNILDREDESATRNDKVLVMPENARWVVLNSTTSNAEWYFAKAGSVGADATLGRIAQYTLYDNTQSGLASNNVQEAVDEIKEDIGDLSDETYINTPLFAGYYSISNGKVILNQTTGNFSYVPPIDITGYDRMRLFFYLVSIYTAKTVFVDDEDNVIGEPISTYGNYITVKVPANATKLCISSRTGTSATIYAYGIQDETAESKLKQIEEEIGDDYNPIYAYFSIVPKTGYTYGTGVVNTLTSTNFNGAVIDLDAGYQYIGLRFRTLPNNEVKTFFVDSNGQKVGDYLTQINTSWRDVKIPENATRLYVSSYQYCVALRYYQKKGTTQRITNIERNIGELSIYEDIDISYSFKTYYTYNSGPVTHSHDNFTGAVIDVRNYNYLILGFSNIIINAAQSFFTDDNGQMKGERITNNGGQLKVAVPSGATKLYISGFRSTIYAVGIKGNGNTLTERLDNIESAISIGPAEFLQNISWRYEYNTSARAGYYIIRINKKKLYGTSQYPFVWYTPTRRTAQEIAASAGFYFVMNCATSPFETVVGQVIVNGEVINNTPHTHHVGAMPLTINNSGDLGYAAADADAYELVNNGIVSACVGFCPIVDNYLPLEPPIIADADHFTQRRQRQVIGQYGNGDYCIITCEGKNASGTEFDNSAGFTLAETRALCIANNLKFAYFCDGGSSTETVIMKKQLNLVYEGSTGRTRDMFIVFNGSAVYTPSQE